MQVASKLRSVLNACGQTGCWEERQGRKKKKKKAGNYDSLTVPQKSKLPLNQREKAKERKKDADEEIYIKDGKHKGNSDVSHKGGGKRKTNEGRIGKKGPRLRGESSV